MFGASDNAGAGDGGGANSSVMVDGDSSPISKPEPSRGVGAAAGGAVGKGVTFNEKQPSDGAAAPAAQASAVAATSSSTVKASSAPKVAAVDDAADVNSVERALANAQRLKESMQSEVAKLKHVADGLTAEVDAARAKSDEYESRGLRLHHLAAQCKSLEESNAARRDSLKQAQERATNKFDTFAFDAPTSSAPPSLRDTASNGSSHHRDAVTLQTSSTLTESTGAAKSPGAVMYLSTVLVMMLLAYAVGITFRVLRLKGQAVDVVDFLPHELQDLARNWIDIVLGVVGNTVQK